MKQLHKTNRANWDAELGAGAQPLDAGARGLVFALSQRDLLP